MAECWMCVAGIAERYGSHLFVSPAAPEDVTVPCKRGPIERELRAFDWRNHPLADPYFGAMSRGAFQCAIGAFVVCDGPRIEDIASEAIECAAELGI